MESANKQNKTMGYTKGLLIRIIVACSIFILMFLAGKFSVKVLDYDIKDVNDEIQDNSFVEDIEAKLKSFFTKEDNP